MPLAPNLANAMLDQTYRNTAATMPTAWYVMLHYDDPGLNGTSNAHLACPRPQVTDWSTSTVGSIANAVVVSLINVPPLPVPHEQVTHVSIWTSQQLDALIATAPLATARLCTGGENISFEPGEIVTTLS